jgi:TonB family protein
MAYSPVAPPHSGAQGPHSFMPISNAVRDEPAPAKADAGAIFSALRDAIAGGASDLDVLLGAIAEAAQALTMAGGTALAMQRGGKVVCLGRSGETAPELGARLSIDSGISGECLRTGRTLRCDDSQKDYRADPEVCRKMGLRSIAAVPLRGRHGVVGILEAFSSRPGAFAEEHMDYLARLAELAETAHAREHAAPAPLVLETLETHSRLSAVSDVLLQSRTKVVTYLGEGKRRYWTVAATLVLLLISFAAWRIWQKPVSKASAAAQPTQSQDLAPTPDSAVGAELAWKPSPERPLNATRVGAKLPEQLSAKTEVSETRSKAEPSPVSFTKIQDLTATDTVKRSIMTESDNEAVAEAPRLSASNLDNAKIGTLVSAPVRIPKFGTPISQGVSEGVLERQVAPIYPRQALPLRLEGPVVLDATISENGQLENIKVAKGHAMLAQAAIDAVRQWRYRPYLLNGKPVRMQTKITVNFKMPGS